MEKYGHFKLTVEHNIRNWPPLKRPVHDSREEYYYRLAEDARQKAHQDFDFDDMNAEDGSFANIPAAFFLGMAERMTEEEIELALRPRVENAVLDLFRDLLQDDAYKFSSTWLQLSKSAVKAIIQADLDNNIFEFDEFQRCRRAMEIIFCIAHCKEEDYPDEAEDEQDVVAADTVIAAVAKSSNVLTDEKNRAGKLQDESDLVLVVNQLVNTDITDNGVVVDTGSPTSSSPSPTPPADAAAGSSLFSDSGVDSPTKTGISKKKPVIRKSTPKK